MDSCFSFDCRPFSPIHHPSILIYSPTAAEEVLLSSKSHSSSVIDINTIRFDLQLEQPLSISSPTLSIHSLPPLSTPPLAALLSLNFLCTESSSESFPSQEGEEEEYSEEPPNPTQKKIQSLAINITDIIIDSSTIDTPQYLALLNNTSVVNNYCSSLSQFLDNTPIAETCQQLQVLPEIEINSLDNSQTPEFLKKFEYKFDTNSSTEEYNFKSDLNCIKLDLELSKSLLAMGTCCILPSNAATDTSKRTLNQSQDCSRNAFIDNPPRHQKSISPKKNNHMTFDELEITRPPHITTHLSNGNTHTNNNLSSAGTLYDQRTVTVSTEPEPDSTGFKHPSSLPPPSVGTIGIDTMDEIRDQISPMPVPLTAKFSYDYGSKRPSASTQLSSPMHSRRSITPRGPLDPLRNLHSIHTSGSIFDDEVEISDSKDDDDYGTIETPIGFIKEYRSITKFVATQIQLPNMQLSEKNMVARRERRVGVSNKSHSRAHTQTSLLSKTSVADSVIDYQSLSPRFLMDNCNFSSMNTNLLLFDRPLEFLKKTLQGNLLFSGVDAEFSAKMVDKVSEMLRPALYDTNEILIKQGMEGDAFYLIESGSFAIIHTLFKEPDQSPHTNTNTSSALPTTPVMYCGPTLSRAGSAIINIDSIKYEKMEKIERTVAYASRGECVGEYSLLYNQPRTATLRAIEPSKVWGITADQFRSMRQEIMKWNIERFVNRQKFLASIPLFQQLQDHEILNLTHACHAEIYDPDQFIIFMTEPNDNIYIIMEGTVLIETCQKIDLPPEAYHHTDICYVNKHMPTLTDMMDDDVVCTIADANAMGNGLRLSYSTRSHVSDGAPLVVEIGKSNQVSEHHNYGTASIGFSYGLEPMDIGTQTEYGMYDYFARSLFKDEDSTLEILCAKAETQVKVLRVRKDDFTFIMAETAVMLDDIIDDQELPDCNYSKRIDCTLDDFEMVCIIGVGSFGTVKLNGDTYALKEVRKSRVIITGQEEHIINEKRVIAMLDSPFCIKLFATFQSKRSVFFLTELVLGGELFTVLRYNSKFDKNSTRFYAGCVILALEHLHSKNIIYRDLKPENLLLSQNGYLKLTDFGFAKKRNTSCTLCGTPQYLAPEVIHNWVQSFATDWWALGVLLYEMVVGNPPFEDDENMKMYEKILQSDADYPIEMNCILRHLIQKLLDKNAYLRLGSGIQGARDVKRHPFFVKKLDWEALLAQTLEPPYVPTVNSNVDSQNFDNFSDYETEPDDEDEDFTQIDEYAMDWANAF